MENKTKQTSSKKAKINHARAIHTQKVKQNHRPLPKFLDIEKFISSRSFEIGALERSMNLARQASTQRSFQTLPRHLRRRTASHVARRVPIKLRSKARFEMKNDKPKVLSKSVRRKLSFKIYKNRDRTKVLLKRQLGKKWLKTHIWHAKRTKMIDLWGFRLAKTPTEKCFRPTYRAAKHGFTLHDLSYYTHLNLTAQEDVIKRLLRKICDPIGVDPCSIKFKPGHRAVEVNLYSHQGWPSSLIGPATLIWRPASDSTSLLKNSNDQPVTPSTAPAHSINPSSLCTVLLQIHPSTTDDVIQAIKAASDNQVDVTKAQELGCLELGGARCMEKIGRVLTGINDIRKREVLGWFEAALKPNVVPMGLIVGLTVDDPRLKFPPKKKKNSWNQLTQLQQTVIQPTVSLARCDEFWDRYREQNKVKFKKLELDKRREALEIPGSELDSTEVDDRISLLLVRLGDGWKMIMPNEWTKAFFHSLIFTSARLICLDQRAQLDFEAGRPSFPRDFATIKPAIELVNQEGSEEARYWARKPPAKRVNYALMDDRGGPSGGDPFVADWNVVIGQKGIQRNKRGEILKDVQNEHETAENSCEIQRVDAWILIGPLLKVLIENLEKFVDSTLGTEPLVTVCELGLQLMDQIVRKLKTDLDGSQDHVKAQDWNSALVRVKLVAKGNDGNAGVIQPLARLYWECIGTKHEGEEFNKKELIGLITTGRFALSRGSSLGFGAISLKKLVQMIVTRRWADKQQMIHQAGESNMKRRVDACPSRTPRIQFDILYRNKNKYEAQLGRIVLIDY